MYVIAEPGKLAGSFSWTLLVSGVNEVIEIAKKDRVLVDLLDKEIIHRAYVTKKDREVIRQTSEKYAGMSKMKAEKWLKMFRRSLIATEVEPEDGYRHVKARRKESVGTRVKHMGLVPILCIAIAYLTSVAPADALPLDSKLSVSAPTSPLTTALGDLSPTNLDKNGSAAFVKYPPAKIELKRLKCTKANHHYGSSGRDYGIKDSERKSSMGTAWSRISDTLGTIFGWFDPIEELKKRGFPGEVCKEVVTLAREAPRMKISYEVGANETQLVIDDVPAPFADTEDESQTTWRAFTLNDGVTMTIARKIGNATELRPHNTPKDSQPSTIFIKLAGLNSENVLKRANALEDNLRATMCHPETTQEICFKAQSPKAIRSPINGAKPGLAMEYTSSQGMLPLPEFLKMALDEWSTSTNDSDLSSFDVMNGVAEAASRGQLFLPGLTMSETVLCSCGKSPRCFPISEAYTDPYIYSIQDTKHLAEEYLKSISKASRKLMFEEGVRTPSNSVSGKNFADDLTANGYMQQLDFESYRDVQPWAHSPRLWFTKPGEEGLHPGIKVYTDAILNLGFGESVEVKNVITHGATALLRISKPSDPQSSDILCFLQINSGVTDTREEYMKIDPNVDYFIKETNDGDMSNTLKSVADEASFSDKKTDTISDKSHYFASTPNSPRPGIGESEIEVDVITPDLRSNAAAHERATSVLVFLCAIIINWLLSTEVG